MSSVYRLLDMSSLLRDDEDESLRSIGCGDVIEGRGEVSSCLKDVTKKINSCMYPIDIRSIEQTK